MCDSKLFKLFICLFLPFFSYAQTSSVSGTLRKWHKIAVTVNIPGTSFDESSSTFKDHRLDVVFTNPQGDQMRVPGFFVADGDAANSGATSGNKFVAYLRPNMTGTWKYQALYYKQVGIAAKWANQLPEPIYRLNGTVGTIAESDKTSPDFRAQGRLRYQLEGNTKQKRYLQFEGSKEYFLKLGPDSPENLLNYEDFDFDGTRQSCGRCTAHKYQAHAVNYGAGNPTWKNGKGKNLIGVLNYLKDQKMNSISMSLFGGDDPNVFPWTGRNNRYNYDVSKLAQWEVVFDHAEKNGLLLHFKLAENENWDALDVSQLRVYYREMIARFGHHLAVEWNISEEYRGTAKSAIARIDWLADLDPWQNHRVIHTYPGEHKKYQDWLDLKAKLTGASIQTSNANEYQGAFSGKDGILTWINNSKKAGSPWVVASDEQNTGERGVFTSSTISDKNVVKEARTRVLWKVLMAGGAGVMWYGGSLGDFLTEDFGRFDTLFKWSRYAIIDFFKKYKIAFWDMENNDSLVSANSAHCLEGKGNQYVIYLENGGTTNLNLEGEDKKFNVQWFDPRNGGALQVGSVATIMGGSSVSIGNPPNSNTSDWVVFVTKEDDGKTNPIPQTSPHIGCSADFVEKDKRVIIEAENLNISGTSWVKKSDKSGSTGSGYISWEGANNFAKPSDEKLTATIEIRNPGKYRFQWRNTFGKGNNTTEHNDSWLRFPDASDFYAEQGASKVYPIGSGKTPNASKGGGADGWFKVWLASDTNWSWYSRTWDANSHPIYVEFDKPGVYTIEISGRSQYHLLDRIILYQEGVDAQNIRLGETACSTPPPPPAPPVPAPTPEPEPTPEPTNTKPIVAFISPTNGTKYELGDTMIFTAEASDKDGYISNVLFFSEGTYLGGDNKAPFTMTQNAAKVGKYSITAIATDNKGNSTTSEVLTVEITEPKTIPTPVPVFPEVSLTGIKNGSVFKMGSPIAIGATATDVDGTITKVEFFAKGVISLGVDTNPAYTTVFRPAFAGTYSITARATDNDGNVTTSVPMDVIVRDVVEEEVDQKPKVRITGINEKERYSLKEGVRINADATDADGKIHKVVFYEGGVSNLGEEFVAPYSIQFKPKAAGVYQITARATDNDGNVTISTPVAVTIVADGDNITPVKLEPTTTINTRQVTPLEVVTQNVSLSPVHDAYLQDGKGYNTTIIRTEKGRRKAYFMFDVSEIKGTVETAMLQLVVSTDSGNGILRVYEGVDVDWKENTLTAGNAPATNTASIGEIDGSYSIGEIVQIPIDISAIKGDQITLVVEQSSGNDVAFSSKENNVNTPPQLLIAYKPNAQKNKESKDLVNPSLKVYPNPVTTIAYLEGTHLEGSLVQLYTMSGALVYTKQAESNVLALPVDKLASGVYFVKTLSVSGISNMIRLAVGQ